MFFVYYNDGYHDNGDVGFAPPFETESAALAFIKARYDQKVVEQGDPDLSNYILIEGKVLNIRTIEVATKIEVAR